jgi:hypothetical protein
MLFGVDETNELWNWLTQEENLSMLLVFAAVALTASADLVLRIARARTARRLRVAAAAYADREIANECRVRRNPAVRLSATIASA